MQDVDGSDTLDLDFCRASTANDAAAGHRLRSLHFVSLMGSRKLSIEETPFGLGAFRSDAGSEVPNHLKAGNISQRE